MPDVCIAIVHVCRKVLHLQPTMHCNCNVEEGFALTAYNALQCVGSSCICSSAPFLHRVLLLLLERVKAGHSNSHHPCSWFSLLMMIMIILPRDGHDHPCSWSSWLFLLMMIMIILAHDDHDDYPCSWWSLSSLGMMITILMVDDNKPCVCFHMRVCLCMRACVCVTVLLCVCVRMFVCTAEYRLAGWLCVRLTRPLDDLTP